MSQAGVLDVVGSTPEIPVQFDTDSGSAVPVANVLNILGGTGVTTVGSGNTITIDLTGSVATTYIANTGTATPAANDIDILGNYVLAGGAPCSTSASGHTLLVNVQLSTASASSSANSAGACSFSSTDFSVDANGYVTFNGSEAAESLTGNSGGSVSPTDGNINTVATGSITIVGTPLTSTLTTELTGLTAHAVLVGAGTATITKVGPTATSGQVLQSQGSSTDPAFSTATYPSTTTINQILYSSSANVVGGISTLDNGVLITSATGVPELLANSGTPGYVLTANSGAPPSWQTVSASGAITTIDGDSGSATPSSGVVTISGGTTGLTTSGSGSTLDLTGTLKLANGGTNASLTASNGGIFYSTATAGAILAGTATADQVLLSGSSTTPAWSTATYPATTTINQLLYSSSANVIAGLATADNGVLTTGTSGIPVITALSSDGQVIIGSSAGAPAAATLTAGAGVSIANGHNTITISSTGGGFTWHDTTGGSATLAAQNGYKADSASLTTFTLPTNNALGDTIIIMGGNTGGWKIVYGAGQYIQFGSSATTTTTGNLASTNSFDSCTLVCITASASAPIFQVLSSVGNLAVT